MNELRVELSDTKERDYCKSHTDKEQNTLSSGTSYAKPSSVTAHTLLS